ncbi:MAG: type IX secretion system outer membrane channel protein PorV [Bacteroidota bacterium]|nr:type IX secretion system outer membrane channel protein PorV [Bacteroidota bacterium]
MIRKIKVNLFLLVTALLLTQALNAQISRGEVTGQLNAIQTAVPFLTIAPDSRAGAMGDAGVATSPDINSQHWNPAKYAFIEGSGGFSLSYSPWLRNLVSDINLAYLTGYYRIDKKQVVSASLLYFSLGNIVFTDMFANVTRNFNPNEFAIDLAYSRAFSDYISGGIAFRWIYSNLAGGVTVNGAESKPGNSFAADISTYYNRDVKLFGLNGNAGFGVNISNIGTKVSYTDDKDPDFIPTNLRIGGIIGLDIDEFNSVALTVDLNKLLVPTPPVYWEESDTLDDGTIVTEGDIKYGMDPNVSVPVGMFQSFYDAPGGISEEFNEITYSVGLEYWYNKQFAVRGGYFHEHSTKGNRKFFTMGVGLKLNVLDIDFSYLLPLHQNHPLSNTLRFSLLFSFDPPK